MSLSTRARAVLAGVAAAVIAALGTAAIVDHRHSPFDADARPAHASAAAAAPAGRARGAATPGSAVLDAETPLGSDALGRTREDDPAGDASSRVPPRPAAMATAGREGAIAAAEYFLELSNATYLSGDTTAWDALSDPGCVWCANVSDATRATAAQYPERSGGARDAAVLLTVSEGELTARWSFLVRVHTEPSVSRDAAGTAFVDEGGDVVSGIDLGFEDGDWVVYDLVPEVDVRTTP